MTPGRALSPFAAGLGSELTLGLTTWPEFRQVKAGADSHWTERAREPFPVPQSARPNLWLIPWIIVHPQSKARRPPTAMTGRR